MAKKERKSKRERKIARASKNLLFGPSAGQAGQKVWHSFCQDFGNINVITFVMVTVGFMNKD